MKINTLNMVKVKKLRDQLIKQKLKKREKNNHIILGLDISKASCGFAFYDAADDKVLHIDKIVPKTSDNAKIIIDFTIVLDKLLKHYKPSVAIIEDIFLKPNAGNFKAFKSLAKHHGMILSIMATRGIECKYIHPSSAKAFLGCKSKEEVFEKICAIYNLYGLNFKKDNDLIDGILVALNYKNVKKLKQA